MSAILTSVIGTIAKGPTAKARAGAIAGGLLMSAEPIIDAFTKGLSAGALPKVEELGVMLGQAIVGIVIGYATVWLAPKNAETK